VRRKKMENGKKIRTQAKLPESFVSRKTHRQTTWTKDLFN